MRSRFVREKTRSPRRSACWSESSKTIRERSTWPQVHQPVRVIRSLEHRTVHRQLTDEDKELVADWTWVTTLSKPGASTPVAVQIGHWRWAIENRGFNELATRRHADHV